MKKMSIKNKKSLKKEIRNLKRKKKVQKYYKKRIIIKKRRKQRLHSLPITPQAITPVLSHNKVAKVCQYKSLILLQSSKRMMRNGV